MKCELDFSTCQATKNTCPEFKKCALYREEEIVLNFQAQEQHRANILKQNWNKPVVLEEERATEEE